MKDILQVVACKDKYILN